MTAIWTGRLVRNPKTGVITAWLEDKWGWRVNITGTWDDSERQDYALIGEFGEAPPALRIPIIDDEPGKL